MEKELLVSDSDSWALHLVSTPIAVMADYGLSTYVGLSSDDPINTRNKDTQFSVIISAFANSKLIGRAKIAELKPNEHRFFSLDKELEKLGWHHNARLCVVHRLPSSLIENGKIKQKSEGEKYDYSMYRTVVQYRCSDKGMGGLIYETPPNFNRVGGKPHFLSFSNKLYLDKQVENYLVFINYSVSSEYSQDANVKLHFYSPDGKQLIDETINVKSFDYYCLQVNDLVKISEGSKFLSYSAAGTSSALIPLSILVNSKNGGVSVEHSHPPQEYLLTDWPLISKIKLEAAKYLFEN
jgi:hypothetical protein